MQYYGLQRPPPRGPHFLLIVGVLTMVAPYVIGAFGGHMSAWVSYTAWGLIALGIILTIAREVE